MVKIALLGLGTVGTGVAEILEKNAASLAEKAGKPLKLAYILVRRDRPDSPWQDRFVRDFSVIEQDPEVLVVAECMGGTDAAYDYVKRALLAGKHVVTSNKELIAQYGQELLTLARERNLNLLFEASVGGGIPILRPLSTCLAANAISEITGIINGTTNFILTQMLRENLSYAEALSQAVALGYAEADPTADVEGFDAARKICILAALAFGRHIYPDQVPTTGITALTREDTAFAAAGGYRIKLLGRARQMEDGTVSIFVAPHFVPQDQLLADVEDVFNAIAVKGDAVGEVVFYGRGAGKLPTASAVVADIIDALRHTAQRKPVDWKPGGPEVVSDARAQARPWFIRTAARRELVAESFGPVEWLHTEAPGQAGFITGPMTWYQLQEIAQKGLPILSQIAVYRP